MRKYSSYRFLIGFKSVEYRDVQRPKRLRTSGPSYAQQQRSAQSQRLHTAKRACLPIYVFIHSFINFWLWPSWPLLEFVSHIASVLSCFPSTSPMITVFFHGFFPSHHPLNISLDFTFSWSFFKLFNFSELLLASNVSPSLEIFLYLYSQSVIFNCHKGTTTWKTCHSLPLTISPWKSSFFQLLDSVTGLIISSFHSVFRLRIFFFNFFYCGGNI